MDTAQMLKTHPEAYADLDPQLLARCIDACAACEQACTTCADACLGEQDLASLATCIRLDLDCADVCSTTASILTRHTGVDLALVRSIVGTCIAACEACAAECTRHADMHEHCKICAEACQACLLACRDLIASLG